jgi:hypothetical protein
MEPRMNRKKNTRAKTVTVLAILAFSAAGCELLVNFDHSLIDAGSVDGALGDVSNDLNKPDAGDAGMDTSMKDVVGTDTFVPDSGMDSSTADANDGAMGMDADDGANAADTADE